MFALRTPAFRFPLWICVLALPTIVACLAAKSQLERMSELRYFKLASHSLKPPEPNGIYRAFGHERTVEILTALAEKDHNVAFDGEDRYVGILHVPYSHGHDLGDGYFAVSLKHGQYVSWTARKGAEILSAKFEGGELVLQVCGELGENGSSRFVPDSTPIECRLNWPLGERRPLNDIHEVLEMQLVNY